MRTRIWVRLAGWGCCLWLCQGVAGLPGWCAAGESAGPKTAGPKTAAPKPKPGAEARSPASPQGAAYSGERISLELKKRRPQGLLSAHRRHQRPQHRSGPGRGRGPHAFPQGGALGPGTGRGAEEPGHGQALERQRAQDRQTVDPGGGTAAATAVGPGPGGGSRGPDPDSPSQLRQGGGTESHPQEGALPPGRHHRGRTHQRPGHFRHSSQTEGGGDPLAATGSQGPSGRDRSPGGGCQPEFPAGHRGPVERALRAAGPTAAAGRARAPVLPSAAFRCWMRLPPGRSGRG